MGFPRDRAEHALRTTAGDAERAADWLFTHADEPLPAAVAAASGPAAPPAAADAGGPAPGLAASTGTYRLIGIVSHMGSSTSSGHYVAHVLQRWGWVGVDRYA